MFSRATIAVTHAKPVEKVVTETRPGRALARRFVAGDTLDEAAAVALRLNAEGFLVSLDLLGEEVHDEASAHVATDEYIQSLERINEAGLDANISVKPTQLGLSIDESIAFEAIDRLGEKASEVGTTVTIDMEDSRYTEATIRLFEKGQASHGNYGIAIQSYLRRTPEDLERLVGLGGHIRLCKGAYVESEDVALTSDHEIDAAYARQLEVLMTSPSTKPAIATHDSSLLDLAAQLAEDRKENFEFQMLYGVRTDVQKQLVADGHPLRIYLPFGSQWYPYLTRRLAERPANAWFFARALLGK